MASREEEEFELVLGNKQLLSLFFLVVVLFGVFFSFGYTVGFGRGQGSRGQEVAGVEPVEEPAQKVQLPETLLESAPKPTEPTEPTETAKAEAANATSKKESSPAPTRTTPAKAAPKPSPVEETTKSSPPPAQKTAAVAKTSPPAKTSAPAKSSPPPTTSADGDLQLQISAVRVKADAEVYVQQLKAKGHPAILSDRGDGWYRVMVGPFNSETDAKNYQQRLEQEGVESLLRKR